MDLARRGKAIGLDLAADLSKSIPALGTLLKNADLQRRFREKAWESSTRQKHRRIERSRMVT